jgi:hypothetical protein
MTENIRATPNKALAHSLSLLVGFEPTLEPICQNVKAANAAIQIRLAAMSDRTPPANWSTCIRTLSFAFANAFDK